MSNSIPIYVIFSFILKVASMIATILSLNGGLLTRILCIHNQYLVSIHVHSHIKLSVCLSVYDKSSLCVISVNRVFLIKTDFHPN